MPVFDYVLILLAAVLLSNLINRFLPALSVPIVQIIIGMMIALIPFGAFGFAFELEPELFFVLFIAPLVFYSSMTADKKTLWDMKKPILGAAVGLVLVTVIVVGYFLRLLLPLLPLAAAFALAAALGPTDVVAVDAVAKRVPLPRKIIGILSGESIINDAIGIVCFQFAIAASMTGSFSLPQGLWRFLVLGIGGILTGLILTWLKYLLVRWLRSLGIENVTLHILIGLLTPFIIYMIAESISVSGVLAVFSAGIAHSFSHDKFNPETVNLKIAQESVWSALSFSLEGLVFVILGTQLPAILKTIAQGAFPVNGWLIAGYVLLIMLVILLIRFGWWVVAVGRKAYEDPKNPLGKIKSGLIFSLAGTRGVVPLAIVLSIPILLPDGRAFPARNFIILITSAVIVVSLLITNFVLPLLIEPGTDKSEDGEEQSARSEILQTVISRLKSAATPATFVATEIVINSYYSRLKQRPFEGRKARETAEEQELRCNILLWEKEHTLKLVQAGQVSETTAKRYLEILDARLHSSSQRKRNPARILAWAGHFFRAAHRREANAGKSDFWELMSANTQFVLDKLNMLQSSGDHPAAEKIAAEYEFAMSLRQDQGSRRERIADSEAVLHVADNGFQIERELIQQMFEEGRISWETAQEMRSNISTLEARLQAEQP